MGNGELDRPGFRPNCGSLDKFTWAAADALGLAFTLSFARSAWILFLTSVRVSMVMGENSERVAEAW